MTYNKTYMAQYYKKNRIHRDEISRKAKTALRIRNKKFTDDYKSCVGCIDCGEKDPVVLDFDHRDSKTKDLKIGHVLREVSLKRIKLEIEKCDIRCANCHRRKHARQLKIKEKSVKGGNTK